MRHLCGWREGDVLRVQGDDEDIVISVSPAGHKRE